MIKQQMDIMTVLHKLELPPDCFNLMNSRSFNEAAQKLSDFKDLVKNQRKKLAKKYHPDINPDMMERMQEINDLTDMLLKSQLQPPPRPQPQVVRVYRTYGTATSFGGTSTSTYYTGF